MEQPDTWIRAVEAFANDMGAGGMPANTIKLRRSHLRRFSRHCGRAPFDVSLDDLTAYLASNPDWSPNYRRGLRTTLRAFYAWAERCGYVERNVALLTRPVKIPRARPRPTPEDRWRGAHERSAPRERVMILLGARAGLRAFEIGKVHRRDLVRDLLGWSLHVVGKGGHVRVIPLADDVAGAMLERFRELYGDDPDAAGWLFPGKLPAGHMGGQRISELLSWALGGGGAHQLRHRYGTQVLRAAGGNLLVARDLLGHASVATTQIYTLVDHDDVRAAAIAV